MSIEPCRSAFIARPRGPAVAGHGLEQPVVGQGVGGDAVAAGHRLGGDERVDDRLLGRLDRRVEQRRRSRSRSSARMSSVTRGSVRNEVRGRRPVARSRSTGTGRRSSARRCRPSGRSRGPARWASRSHWWGRSGASVATMTMIEPEPGGGAGRRSSSSAAYGLGDVADRDRLADRHPVDPQPVAPAVVGLDEHADGVAAERRRRRPATPSRSRP